jgi:hypothetical protein
MNTQAEARVKVTYDVEVEGFLTQKITKCDSMKEAMELVRRIVSISATKPIIEEING